MIGKVIKSNGNIDLNWKANEVFNEPKIRTFSSKVYILNSTVIFPFTTTDLATETEQGKWKLITDTNFDLADFSNSSNDKFARQSWVLANTPQGDYLGAITPSSTPTGSGANFWSATQAGTYTNFGGVVVNPNSFAFISRSATGVFSISQTALDLSTYAKITDLEGYSTKIDLNFAKQLGEDMPVEVLKINPSITIYKASNVLESRTLQTWYNLGSTKIINFLEVPVVRRLNDNISFTDGIIVKVGLNNGFIFTTEITLAQINAGGYNAMTLSTPDESFRFKIDIPDTKLVSGDVLYIGMTCKSASDKMGFASVTTAANEWNPLKIYYGSININTYSTPPNATVANSSAHSMSVNFGYNDYVASKIPDVSSFTAFDYIDLADKQGESIALLVQKINTPISVYKANNVVDSRVIQTWFKGITKKIVNNISVPIVRRLTDNLPFTNSLYLKFGINGVIKYSREITLAEINAGGFNATTVSTPDEDFFMQVAIPIFEIQPNDVIYFGLMCKSTSDKMGFPATQNSTNEWGEKRFTYGVTPDISNITLAPAAPASSNYSFSFRLGFNDYVAKKIVSYLPTEITKSYSDLPYTRAEIASFLSKLQGKENVKVVVLGDSIANFQNSETLSLTGQKTAPIGLCGNSWVRQLWQSINYNVWNDARTTIVNINGNLGFKRFDQADAIISNGYQGTSAAIGSFDWATNRNDSTDSWRNNGFMTGFAQSIMDQSSFNKPMIGTIKVGATFQITVPSTSIGCSIVFGRGTTRATNVTVKINNGTTDVISETLDMNALMTVTELHKDYILTSGTTKTITVTNVSGNELWIWGVEYWSANCVRVINSGRSSGTSTRLSSDFDFLVKNQNPDIVVFQTPTGNDYNTNVDVVAHAGIASTLYGKLDALNVPILTILCHRFVTNKNIDRLTTSAGIIGVSGFWPDYNKTFKSLAYRFNFGVIDMFSKSVDEIGISNTAVAPINYLLDDGHLSTLGNNSYTEELKKVILWDDFK